MSVRGSVPTTRGLEFPFVMQRHGNLRGAIHHVIVGQDVAFGADDHARSESLLGALARHLELRPAAVALIAEELAEERFQSLRDLTWPLP